MRSVLRVFTPHNATLPRSPFSSKHTALPHKGVFPPRCWSLLCKMKAYVGTLLLFFFFFVFLFPPLCSLFRCCWQCLSVWSTGSCAAPLFCFFRLEGDTAALSLARKTATSRLGFHHYLKLFPPLALIRCRIQSSSTSASGVSVSRCPISALLRGVVRVTEEGGEVGWRWWRWGSGRGTIVLFPSTSLTERLPH